MCIVYTHYIIGTYTAYTEHNWTLNGIGIY